MKQIQTRKIPFEQNFPDEYSRAFEGVKEALNGFLLLSCFCFNPGRNECRSFSAWISWDFGCELFYLRCWVFGKQLSDHISLFHSADEYFTNIKISGLVSFRSSNSITPFTCHKRHLLLAFVVVVFIVVVLKKMWQMKESNETFYLCDMIVSLPSA